MSKKRISITIGHIKISGLLNSSRSAERIWESLPLSASITTWGKEIYFPVPVQVEEEEPFSKAVVEKGDLAFWPEGRCFCIFYGPTPISEQGEIRPASSVNVIGYIQGNFNRLNEVEDLNEIKIEQDG
jgi:hypothetical protein